MKPEYKEGPEARENFEKLGVVMTDTPTPEVQRARELTAVAVHHAMKRYAALFCEPCHGTYKQVAAMVELIPKEFYSHIAASEVEAATKELREQRDNWKSAAIKADFKLTTAEQRGQELHGGLQELSRKWRSSGEKSAHHSGDAGMEIENETHMNDMKMCADGLDAVLSQEPAKPKEGQQ